MELRPLRVTVGEWRAQTQPPVTDKAVQRPGAVCCEIGFDIGSKRGSDYLWSQAAAQVQHSALAPTGMAIAAITPNQ